MIELVKNLVVYVTKYLILLIVYVFVAALLLFGGMSRVHAQCTPPSCAIGVVSFYGKKFHAKKTANGEIFDMNKFTCAATKDYKFGEVLRVTNIANGKSVIVKVNDRGAFKKYGRTLDLSRAAFEEIADYRKGIVKVKIERIK